MKEQFQIYAEDGNGKCYVATVTVNNWIANEKSDMGVTNFRPEILTRIEYIVGNYDYAVHWTGRFIPSYICTMKP